jgi:hypothetical protein
MQEVKEKLHFCAVFSVDTLTLLKRCKTALYTRRNPDFGGRRTG